MSVYRNNNKWYCRGRVNGERYHLLCQGAKTKEEAKEIDASERLKILRRQRGLLENEKDYTFSFMIERFVEVSKLNNRTWKTSVVMSKYILDYFGKNKSIRCVRVYNIENFKKHLLNKGLKNATVNRYLAALKRAYNILIEEELITYNPVKKVKMLTEDNKRYRYLTKNEWNKLKLVMPKYLYYIVVVALLTGLRKSNVLNLKWEQIDFQVGMIEILRQNAKGKKLMRVPMSDSLQKVLIELNPKQSGYVFVNPETNTCYTDIKKSFKTALNRAGITDFKFHDLRRTVGTWLMRNGVDLRTIQTLLFHSDISTTERYLAVIPDSNRKAVSNLDKFIG